MHRDILRDSKSSISSAISEAGNFGVKVSSSSNTDSDTDKNNS